MQQGKIKRELEGHSRNEESAQQEDVKFTIGKTVELDHKHNKGRTKKIIQVEHGSDYQEREKLQPLEKVQENDLVQKEVEPREEKRVKKLTYIQNLLENTGYRDGEGKANEITRAEMPKKC